MRSALQCGPTHASIRGVWGTPEDKVPGKDVVLEGSSEAEGRRVFLHHLVLFGELTGWNISSRQGEQMNTWSALSSLRTTGANVAA
jgi:hypothetical protein